MNYKNPLLMDIKNIENINNKGENEHKDIYDYIHIEKRIHKLYEVCEYHPLSHLF